MTDRLKVWGIAGSLRAQSWNRMLLTEAAKLAPAHVDVHITTLLPEIPFFNEDLVVEPDAVTAMKREVEEADAVLIATPEYNGGVPGVLKNALDWLSWPFGNSVLGGKAIGLMGASVTRLGTARSQFELRHMFVFSHSPVMPGPEVLLPGAPNYFDDNGNLTDPEAIRRIGLLYENLERYAGLHTPAGVRR